MERYNRKGLFYKPSAETVKHLKELQIFFNGKTRIAYPGKLPLVFDLETVCQMVVTHEESHFNQAKEVLEKSESPEEAASDVRQLADNFCYAGAERNFG